MTDKEKSVTCGRLEGKVEYGIVNEAGIADVKPV